MARSAAQRVLHTAVLLPVLLFAVSNLRSIAFLCSMTGDGLLRAECCCPKAQPGEGPDGQDGQAGQDGEGPRLAAASCCQVQQMTATRPPSEVPRVGATFALELPAFSTWAPLLAPPADSAPSFDVPSDRPPPAGPSLLVLKQTFLI